MLRTAFNILAFQAAWVGTAVLAARGDGLLAILPGVAVVGLHLALNPKPADLGLILLAGVMGLGVEGLLMGLGFASYAAPVPSSLAPPAWVIALWCAFGTLPHVSLNWLKGRPLLAALLGALGGGIAYYVGERLKALSLAEPLWITYLVIMALWALALVALMAVARRSVSPSGR